MSPLWSSSCTATTLHSLRSSSGSTYGRTRADNKAATEAAMVNDVHMAQLALKLSVNLQQQ
jgi:hypothetical protein